MRRGRIITGIASLGVAALLAPTALGATPGEIAADLADGRLDGAYTQAELEAYLQSAMVQGYGEPTQPPVVTATVTPPAETPAAGTSPAETSAAGTSPAETPAAGTSPATSADESTATAPSEGVAGVQTSVTQRSATGPSAEREAEAKAQVAGVQTEAKAQVAGVQTPASAVAETAQVGTLPFTGIDLALLTVGGALLLLLGIGARRLGHQHA